jgi:hypothetical protein
MQQYFVKVYRQVVKNHLASRKSALEVVLGFSESHLPPHFSNNFFTLVPILTFLWSTVITVTTFKRNLKERQS